MALLDRLPASLESLSSVCSQFDVELACSVYLHHQAPVLSLSPATVAKLAALRAALDVDVNAVS